MSQLKGYLLFILGVIVLSLFGCSASENQFSPEQVINNALAESSGPTSFYGELETRVIENKGKSEVTMSKEWRTEDGKVRIESENEDGSEETIAVNNGQALITYEVEKNEAFIIDDPELLSFNQPTPKEQADMLLEMVRDTHQISVEGEEKVAGRDTFHIATTPKEEGTLFGEQELWIDKENWMVLKMNFVTGDTKVEMIYTKVDYGTRISSEKFELDLPKDVVIEDLDNMDHMSNINLDEVTDSIGQPVLYIAEDEDIAISNIEKIELQGDINRTEINIDYNRDDLPLFILTIFESDESLIADEEKLPGQKPIKVRNQNGMTIETDTTRTILWQEDGLTYSVTILDPSITNEKLQTLAEEMEWLE